MKGEKDSIMNITVNGNKTDFNTVSTISDLLDNLNLVPETVVVELNTTIIQPYSYAATQLSEGDGVEIIRFVGGG